MPFSYNTDKNLQYVFALFYTGSGTLNCGNFSSHKQLLRKQVQGCAIQAIKNQHLGLLGNNSISIRRDFLFHCLNVEALSTREMLLLLAGYTQYLRQLEAAHLTYLSK